MNRKLIERVQDRIYTLLSGKYGDFGVPSEEEAQAVLKTVGEHLLMELEGSESPCEMRAKIKKECGLS